MNAPTALGFIGKAPGVKIAPTNPERSKYEALWQRNEYREVSPGEQLAMQFLTQARPRVDSEVIDFGCGTGRGALMIALFGRCKVQMVDFATNCLDPEVAQACETQPERIKFAFADLTKPVRFTGAYGYCCDVMEHIPTADVPKVLRNVLASANHVFFGISTVPDEMGVLIGEQLHLTVQPMAWWLEQLHAAGAVVHWAQDFEGKYCAFYCSAWGKSEQIVSQLQINVDVETIESQTRANIEAGWQHIGPHELQKREVVLIAGGPSAAQHLDEIRRLRADGAAIVTVNGSYEWALAQGLVVSVQIVLDAREFNARFTRNVQPGTKYLIASQVHPKTLEGLPRDRTWLWHSGLSDANEQLVRDHNNGLFFPVPGGSTVVLRAIPLLRMLGLAQIHLFGFDSCMVGDKHHAYEQEENNGEALVPVNCGGRTFMCTAWMISQAHEFQDLINAWGDMFEICVHGDGLIKQILTTGAAIAAEQGTGIPLEAAIPPATT